MDYSKYIKLFNYLFTDTVSKNRPIPDIDSVTVNYDNCVSLYDLITSFNRLHENIMKEYNELDKIDFGKPFQVHSFSKGKNLYGKDYRGISLTGINSPIVGGEEMDLHISESEGKFNYFISSISGDSSKFKRIKLDDEKVVKYLDLYEKYQDLLKLFVRLKDAQLYYFNGLASLYIHIDNDRAITYYRDITSNLNSIRLTLISHYFEYDEHFELAFNLGEKITFDSEHSCAVIDFKKHEINEEEAINLLKNIYLNVNHLVSRDDNEKDTEKVKKLIMG